MNANTPELIEAANKSQMKSGAGSKAEYVKYWDNSYPEFNYFYPGEAGEVSLFPKLFLFNKIVKMSESFEGLYAAKKCAASLLSTKNWESFTRDGISDYAIGAPTLKMFVASWDSCHSGSEYLATKNFQDGSSQISMGSRSFFGQSNANTEATIYIFHMKSR